MKAYKYKVKPSRRVAACFAQTLSLCRELYNAALQERRDAYRVCGKSVNYAQQCAQLPAIKAARADVAGLHSQVAQDALCRISRTCDAFFQRCRKGEKPGFPHQRSGRPFGEGGGTPPGDPGIPPL